MNDVFVHLYLFAFVARHGHGKATAFPFPCFHLHVGFVRVFLVVIPESPPSLWLPNFPLATLRFLSLSVFLLIFWWFSWFVGRIPVKVEILWYMFLTTKFISLSIMLCHPKHSLPEGRSSFFLTAAYCFILHICHGIWTHSFPEKLLGCFQHSATVMVLLWTLQCMACSVWVFSVLRMEFCELNCWFNGQFNLPLSEKILSLSWGLVSLT